MRFFRKAYRVVGRGRRKEGPAGETETAFMRIDDGCPVRGGLVLGIWAEIISLGWEDTPQIESKSQSASESGSKYVTLRVQSLYNWSSVGRLELPFSPAECGVRRKPDALQSDNRLRSSTRLDVKAKLELNQEEITKGSFKWTQ